MSFLLELVKAWAGCSVTPTPTRTLDAAELAQRQQLAHRVACPVVASMYMRGLLNPTPEGVITWQDLNAALRSIGFCRSSAMFQAFGIASYWGGDTKQTLRSRGGVHRFMNIFQMSPGETSESAAMQLQHGFSTVIRDSRHDDGLDDAVSVRASRKARFDAVYQKHFVVHVRILDWVTRCCP